MNEVREAVGRKLLNSNKKLLIYKEGTCAHFQLVQLYNLPNTSHNDVVWKRKEQGSASPLSQIQQ